MTSEVGKGATCDDCREKARGAEEAARRGALAKTQDEVRLLRERVGKVLLTTTPGVDGYSVARYVGIESVEYVIGTGLFSEVTSGVADMLGARSTAFEQKLQAAKDGAITALKVKAALREANAVVAVTFNYAEFSGNRVALILAGTLVQIAPLRPAK